MTAIGYFSGAATEFTDRYQTDPDFQERLEVWKRAIQGVVKPQMNVLDIGCGDGIFSRVAGSQGAHVIGIDGSAEMVAKCRPHPFVTYQQQSAPCQRPDWNCRFDVILSSSVLEYVTDLDATVQCIADWIKPGGTVLVSMPNWRSLDRRCERIRYWLRGPAPYFTHVKNFHSVGQLQALSLAKGLQPAGVQYYARNKLISRCGQRIGLPDKWCGNLYLAKFRRPG